MRARLLGCAALAAALVMPGTVQAQQRGSDSANAARRAQLEQRVRERTAETIRRRLALTDAQMQRLASVRERNEARRRALLEQEREARNILRAELAAGDSANQARVAQQLDRLIGVQRDRVALVQQEQRELAEFLTPVQRARYQGLQETLRRRMQAPRPPRPGGPRPAARPAPPRRPGGA